VNDGFPRVVEFIIVFPIKEVRTFLNFQEFSNDLRVVGHMCKDFDVIKENKVFGVMGTLNNNNIFNNMIMMIINYMPLWQVWMDL
jgi:hypothetical protein